MRWLFRLVLVISVKDFKVSYYESFNIIRVNRTYKGLCKIALPFEKSQNTSDEKSNV